MNALNLKDGALRIGVLHYNTDAEVDRTLEVLTTLAAR
jgi:selenocysteine lyase/cysteine desulfurase